MQRRNVIFWVMVLLPAVVGAPVRGETIADSTADWSVDGLQGENGWFYGWYDLTLDEDEGNGEYDVDDFIPFLNDDSFEVAPDGVNHWDGTQYRHYRDGEGWGAGLPDTGPWTRIGEGGNPAFGHPNGINSGAPTEVDDPRQAEHWAIKRWVSDFNGTVNVTISLASQNLACGNGTTTHLFHNGSLIDTIHSPNDPNFRVGENALVIAAGDFIDYALSPEGEDGGRADPCDGSFFNMIVDSVSAGVPGDFDGDGSLTATDIDLLSAAVGTNQTQFDLNNDGAVTNDDRTVWVRDLKGTWLGDADLNLEFNSSDLVAVLAAGTYEVDVDSGWATGDFNGDRRTNSSDLVVALADGGYEQGPRAAVQAASVPEPAVSTLFVSGLLGMLATSRRNRKQECWRLKRERG